MTRRRQLPAPLPGGDPARLVAELTAIVNEFDRRIEQLERAAFVETNLSRPPLRLGAVAVVAGEVYVATGLDISDWKQVS